MYTHTHIICLPGLVNIAFLTVLIMSVHHILALLHAHAHIHTYTHIHTQTHTNTHNLSAWT